MPGSRIKYDPSLPGGGRVRYVGEDAYTSQQREYETRAVNAPLGYFNAPVWYQQNAGILAYWYADLNPQTSDFSVPAVSGVDNSELNSKYWAGAALQRFVFTSNGQTYNGGWTVVLQPGWWHLNWSAQITGAGGAVLGGSQVVLIPTRVLATGAVAATDRILRYGDYQPPYSGTSFLSGGSDTFPIKEETAAFLWYECDNVAPTLQPSSQTGAKLVGVSGSSGFRIA